MALHPFAALADRLRRSPADGLAERGTRSGVIRRCSHPGPGTRAFSETAPSVTAYSLAGAGFTAFTVALAWPGLAVVMLRR